MSAPDTLEGALMRPLLWAWLVLVCCAGCMEDALRPVPDSPSQPLSVTRVGSGSGTVVSSPEGIVCDPDCQADFEEGSQVTLTATPQGNVHCYTVTEIWALHSSAGPAIARARLRAL